MTSRVLVDAAIFSPNKNKRILLTGARSPCALELARLLHAGGHTVYAADMTTMHVSRFSNAVEKFYNIPSPRFNLEGFITELVTIVNKEKIDLLIPIWEEVIYLSKHLGRFPDSCEVFCDNFQKIHNLHHKWEFIKLLSSLGFKTPRSVLLRSNSDFRRFEFEPPYVLKRCYSRASRFLIKVDTPHPPQINIETGNPWIAQEFIKGNKFCSYSVCYKGDVLAHAAYPVKYTMDGNSCIAFEAVEHKKIYEWVRSFIRKLGYTGQAAFDFIETAEGVLYAIECNPRATSGLHLFKTADRIDKAFLRETDQTIFPTSGNSQQIAVAMLMYGLRKGVGENQFPQYLKKLLTTKDVVFSLRDLKPFLLEPLVLTNYWLRSKKLGISIPLLFTHDLDWDEDIEDK